VKPPHKIAAEDLIPRVRPDELNRIFDLKKNLDRNDTLGTFVKKYRQLGWLLVGLNQKGEVNPELNFQQPEDIWTHHLAELGLEDVLINLAVCTGSSSRLLVIEIHGQETLQALKRQGDWRSNSVVQLDQNWERHFYTLPEGWNPPGTLLLDKQKVKIIGEEGLVLVPPSFDLTTQKTLQWLKSPWETPPRYPEPRLLEFLLENSSGSQEFRPQEKSAIPAWEEIYRLIASHPPLMKALLAPATTEADYYSQLLKTAQEEGLKDANLLLGLLWHAPLGDARNRPNGYQQLQELVNSSSPPRMDDAWQRMTGLLQEISQTLAHLQSTPPPKSEEILAPANMQPPPLRTTGTNNSDPLATLKKNLVAKKDNSLEKFNSSNQNQSQSFSEGKLPQERPPLVQEETIAVERHQYESMIYELGKLGAWHEIQKRYYKENNSLKGKIEAQRQEEINHLRQLLTEKKNKGWWR
jgi:hypothetical protein